MRKGRSLLALFLSFIMVLSFVPNVFAARIPNLPLKNQYGDVVADENTRYITLFSQHPVSKLITATVQVQNNNPIGGTDILMSTISAEISYNDKVSPCDKDGENVFADNSSPMLNDGGDSINPGLIDPYFEYASDGSGILSAYAAGYIFNDATARLISCRFSALNQSNPVLVRPGETLDLVNFYFMPESGENLSLDMFGYETYYVAQPVVRVTLYMADGSCYLTANSSLLYGGATYYVEPEFFKIHVQHPEPAVSANNGSRTVDGYDPVTMEWSDSPDSPYKSEAPIIGESQTIYVRTKGEAEYSGANDEFKDYKKYVPSNPVELVFEEIPVSDQPEINKITEFDKIITGTGEPGAKIEVTFPNGDTETTWVKEDFTWSVDVPDGVILEEGQEVTAVQTEDGKRPSEGVVGTVTGRDASEQPEINKITEGDKIVTGTGVPGAEIEVTFPNGDTETTWVKEDFTWSVDVPEGVILEEGNQISAEQTEDGKRPSEPETAIVIGKTKDPIINLITEGDKVITGTGEPGATIVITLPDDGGTLTTEVGGDGKWSVDVPDDVYLAEGEKVTAIQTEEGREPSDSVTAIVQPKPIADMSVSKTAVNKDSSDDKTRVGDMIEYTITVANNGEDRSVLADTVVTDVLCDGVRYEGNVTINGGPAGGAEDYDKASKTLKVTLGDIPAGTVMTVTFDVRVNTDAYGENITNSATVNAKDGTDGEDIEKTTEEEGDRIVQEKFEGKFSEKTSENLSSNDGNTYVGDTIQYSIRVWNDANEDFLLTDMLITDELPEHVTFTPGSVQIDGEGAKDTDYIYDSDTRTLTVMLGEIAGGSEKIVTFEVIVDDDAHDVFIKNFATITGKDDNREDINEEIEDGEGDIVKNPIDVYATKESSVTDGKAYVGDTITYTITVGNSGEKSIWKNAEVVDELPEHVTFTPGSVKIDGADANDEDYSYNEDTRTLEVYLEDMACGYEKVITFEVTIDEDAAGKTIKNVAKVSNIDEDIEEPGGGTKVYLTVTFDPNGGKKPSFESKFVILDEMYGDLPTVTRDDGFTFDGWYTARTGGTLVKEETDVTNGQNHRLYAHWSSTPVTVTFDPNGGTLQGSATKTVILGEMYGDLPNATRSGYTFDWYTERTGGRLVKPDTFVTNEEKHTLYAQWTSSGGPSGPRPDQIVTVDPSSPNTVTVPDEVTPLAPAPAPGLNKKDHIPYISGYPDRSVRPDNSITRGEAAMIFFKLLLNTDKNDTKASVFKDVDDGAWYAQAINYLASQGILSGYLDGTFKPDQPITRAEFATMASKFDKLESTDNNAFPDVADSHWAKSFINSASVKGWVGGYPDGTFKPDMNITRAEVVTVVNKMLGRKVKLENIPSGIIEFTDLSTNHWAYTDIVEASNNHDYTADHNGYEIWTLK